MNRHAHYLMAVLLPLVTPAAAESLQLGRLFTTPEHRAALDQQRATSLQARSSEESSIHVSGLVKRSSGRNTVWLNGRLETGTPAVGADLSVTLPDAPGAGIRVGETLNRTTGETETPLQTGRIVVTRPGRAVAER